MYGKVLIIIRRLSEKLSGWSSLTPYSRSIFRNMFTLMMGSVGAKFVSFLSLPIITRVYLPEHFGVFALYTSLLALLVPLATLKYEIAIPVPRNDAVAFNHLTLCFLILLLSTLFITIFLALFSESIFSIFDLQSLETFWWLVPVGVLGTGTYTIFTLWGTRTKQFNAIAKTTFTQSIFGALSTIGLAFVLAKPLGLLIGQVIRQSAGVISLLIGFKSDFRVNSEKLNIKLMKFTASYYYSIPKYRLPSQLILVLSSSAPIFFSSYAFGPDVTGQVGLAISIIALPMAIFGRTISNAYFSEIARIGKKEKRKIFIVTKDVVSKLAVISVIPAVTLFFYGKPIFALLFGNYWEDSGVYAGILSIMIVFQFITAPIINILTVFDRQEIFLRINITRFFIILVVFFLSLLLSLSSFQAILFYSVALSIHYLLITAVIFKVVKP